jgi:enamine deaminase RidA (YjgF/YER057c/UK114 family)
MQRQNIASGTPWEEIVGYSRAVRLGPFIHVTGTLAADEHGRMIGTGDAYAQTIAAIGKIEQALKEAGATLEDVVRTRIYVTDIDRWKEIGRAHRELFGKIKPATTMVEVSRLFTPEALVEIEADAILADAP